jgi:hypothetical protein
MGFRLTMFAEGADNYFLWSAVTRRKERYLLQVKISLVIFVHERLITVYTVLQHAPEVKISMVQNLAKKRSQFVTCFSVTTNTLGHTWDIIQNPTTTKNGIGICLMHWCDLNFWGKTPKNAIIAHHITTAILCYGTFQLAHPEGSGT